jgi:hypothetical protein
VGAGDAQPCGSRARLRFLRHFVGDVQPGQRRARLHEVEAWWMVLSGQIRKSAPARASLSDEAA